jgi:hypothetical protein
MSGEMWEQLEGLTADQIVQTINEIEAFVQEARAVLKLDSPLRERPSQVALNPSRTCLDCPRRLWGN